jgi:molecular chaperone GrpE
MKGFNMREAQILSALDTFGLKEVEAEGKPFDAKLMNALEREKAEGKEEQVVAVISKGYTLNGKLIRPAGVKVGY